MCVQEGGKFIPEMEDGHPAVSEVKIESMCTCGYCIPFTIVNTSSHALSLEYVFTGYSHAYVAYRQFPYKALLSVRILQVHVYCYVH